MSSYPNKSIIGDICLIIFYVYTDTMKVEHTTDVLNIP